MKDGGPKTLCASCKYSQITTSIKDEVFVQCHRFDGQRIDRPVKSCSAFRDKAFEHKGELEKMAYIIDLKKKIGFETEVKVHIPGSDSHRKITNPDMY